MAGSAKKLSKGFRSQGKHTSCQSTGRLPAIVDRKQLKLLKPCGYMVNAYEKAEAKRDHLLNTRGTHHILFIKGKRIRVPIPTAHQLAMKA
jgi:hypothetical protein